MIEFSPPHSRGALDKSLCVAGACGQRGVLWVQDVLFLRCAATVMMRALPAVASLRKARLGGGLV